MRTAGLVFLSLLPMLAAAYAQAPAVDQQDPAAVARAYLEACDRWDVEAAAALAGTEEESEALRAAREPGRAATLEQLVAEGLCTPWLKHARHVVGEVVVTGNECRVRAVASYTVPTTLLLRRDEAGDWHVAVEESMLSTSGAAESLFLERALPAAMEGGATNEVTTCLSNLKQLALGALMYAQDHDEVFPPAETWCDDLYPYLKNTQVFCCPVSPYGYAYNAALSKKPLAQVDAPAEMVLFFEAAHREKNAAGDPTKLPLAHRHNGGDCFAYADGHAKWVK